MRLEVKRCGLCLGINKQIFAAYGCILACDESRSCYNKLYAEWHIEVVTELSWIADVVRWVNAGLITVKLFQLLLTCSLKHILAENTLLLVMTAIAQSKNREMQGQRVNYKSQSFQGHKFHVSHQFLFVCHKLCWLNQVKRDVVRYCLQYFEHILKL